jgi:hypothetical protein
MPQTYQNSKWYHDINNIPTMILIIAYTDEYAMILSAISGRVSAMTSISPKRLKHGSFSNIEQYAPRNLFSC